MLLPRGDPKAGLRTRLPALNGHAGRVLVNSRRRLDGIHRSRKVDKMLRIDEVLAKGAVIKFQEVC